MNYSEDDYLQLSGLQHFAFCRRQWALIHIEQQWRDNMHTVEGQILHERTHDKGIRERSSGKIVIRALHIASAELGVSGICDVVEFYRDDNGIRLDGEEGLWRPYPVEYKRGRIKPGPEDRLQLCAQAMCLEEMLGCCIEEGASYYGEIRRREHVFLDGELRSQVYQYLNEMHEYSRRGYTPKVKTGKQCGSCSLKELCLPVLCRKVSAVEYIKERVNLEV